MLANSVSIQEAVTLNLVVALHSEAAPLINFYRLNKIQQQGVQLYSRCDEGLQINLLVAGIGRLAMASGVGWLAGWLAAGTPNRSCWLNIGSAGHEDLEVGTPVRVVQCQAPDTDRAHYPALVAPWRGAIAGLLTGDHVCHTYPAQSLVDMEGSAFFSSALHFAPSELVQSIKVVSDNQESSADELNGAKLTQLIQANTDDITGFAAELIKLTQSMPRPVCFLNEIPELTAHFHTTVSQLQQLQDLSRSLYNLGVNPEALRGHIANASRAKQLIQQWQQQLLTQAPNLSAAPTSSAVQAERTWERS